MSQEKKFYVYVQKYASGPKEGQVFYVGKGSGRRHLSKRDRNKHWINTVNKYGYEAEILCRFNNELCAFSFEKALIKFYGRENLTNLTDGGDGHSGCYPNVVTRKRMSKSQKGRRHSKESKEKMRNNSRSKRVNCSNGMSFPSMSEACRWLNSKGVIGAKTGLISQCCSGRFKTAYGFSWWLDNYKEVLYLPHHKRISMSKSKPVLRSDGVLFYGISEAARKTSEELRVNVSAGNISMVCRGERKTAYGYRWTYLK